MTTVTLTPGAVFSSAGGGPDIPVVGSPPQWNDSSDATYATAAQDATYNVSGQSFLDAFTFPSPPTSLVYHARLEDTSDPGYAGLLDVGLYDSVGSTFFMLDLSTMLVASAGSTPAWFVSDPIAIPDPAAFAAASVLGNILVLTASEGSVSASPNTSVRIYEVYVVATYGASVFPLRRYPPVGNGGFGPTRHVPKTGARHAGWSY